MPKTLAACAAVCFALLLFGCGPGGPTTYEVTGTVTLDGEPIADAQIVFRAVDGSEGSWAAKVTDGEYTVQSTPGKKRVEITATREIHMKVASDSGEGELNYEMYVPEKYNRQSELTREVTADGDNRFDFALEP
ncbi:MAG: hypothetical protein HQ581_17330 [Planctomycetes bacterium]|nr:hypothetical protein [Planctomycetota bacterium]